jgi:hypothetical protein
MEQKNFLPRGDAMSSPFPGMDPFLEGPGWLDFHSTFINYWREAIADGLPDDYDASLGERVYLVEVDPDTRKLVYPDVAVSHAEPATQARSSAGLATLEPVTIPLEIIEGPRETYIEILHRPDGSLVAILKLLSPANKQLPGRTEYLSKRNAILRQNIHLVELEILLGGERLPMTKPLPPADYYYLLARAEMRPDCEVFRWKLRDGLPRLPIPLRAPHADIVVDLGQVFTTAYDRGRFSRRLAYRQPCPAPLKKNQGRWVERVSWRPKNDNCRKG